MNILRNSACICKNKTLEIDSNKHGMNRNTTQINTVIYGLAGDPSKEC